MKKNIVLVYITAPEKELNPAIFNLKAYALSKLKDNPITINTKVIKPSGLKKINDHLSSYISFKELSLISDEILRENPVFVGFSSYIWNVRLVLELVKILKKKQPLLPIVLGGAEATYNARKILSKYKEVDIIALDEAEETFTDLIEYYLGQITDLSKIPGIVYRKQHDIIETSAKKPLDLSRAPSPYLEKLIDVDSNIDYTISLETSRGCPFKCAYCSYNTSNYAYLRFFPLTRVKKELTYILKRDPKRVDIVDDNFNIYDTRSRKILRLIIKNRQKTMITLFIRADVWAIKDELAKLLSKPYLYLTIGVQSLNKTTLSKAKRVQNIAILNKNLNLLNKFGANLTLQFIIGLPGDKYEDIKNDINWAFSYRPSDVEIQTLRINPGTLYEKNSDEFGITYRNNPPYTIFKTNSMNQNELKKCEKIALLFQLLYRSRSFRTKLINFSEKNNQPITDLLEKLANINPYSLIFLPKKDVMKILEKLI